MPVNLRNRTPNAGTIPINLPAQRRMGVKRRLVDQGARLDGELTLRFPGSRTPHICNTGIAKIER